MALSLALVLAAGCGSGSDGSASSASKVSETREEPERETSTTEEPRSTTTEPSTTDSTIDPSSGKNSGKTTTTVAGQAPGSDPSSTALPEGWIVYESSTGASVAHPAEWTIEASSAAPLVLFIDPASSPFRRNINLLIQESGSMSLDDYALLTADQLVQVGAVVDSQGATTWSGRPAYEWRYRATLSGADLAVWSIVTIIDSQAWLLTYTTPADQVSEVLPQVERVFASVVLPG